MLLGEICRVDLLIDKICFLVGGIKQLWQEVSGFKISYIVDNCYYCYNEFYYITVGVEIILCGVWHSFKLKLVLRDDLDYT